jgi:hypothetical protein
MTISKQQIHYKLKILNDKLHGPLIIITCLRL